MIGWNSQFEVRIGFRNLLLDHFLNFDIIFSDQIDRVLLLIDVLRRSCLDRLGSFEDYGSSFAGESRCEKEDLFEVGDG